MHVIVSDNERFKHIIGRAAAVVSKSESNPVQAALKLWTTDNKLMVTALDTTSHQMTLGVEANVQLAGEVLLEADHFSKVVGKMGKHPLTITLEQQRELTIFCGEDRQTFYLFGADVDTFPMEPALPDQVAAIPGATLFNVIRTLLAGSSSKEQDLSFALSTDDERLKAYAGDATSGLLVRCDVALSECHEDLHFKVPFGVLRSLPPFGEGTINIHAKEGVVVFVRGDEHYLIRAADDSVDTDSLDYIFEQDRQGYFVVESKQFRNKVKMLSVSKASQVAKLRVLSDENKLILSATDQVHGSSRLSLGTGDIQGETPTLEFDCSCLDKAIMAINSELITSHYIFHPTEDDEGIWVMKLLDETNPNERQAVVLPVQSL